MDACRIALLGDGGVGKTALAVETYEPTKEDSFHKEIVVDNRVCSLEIFDTSGGEESTTLQKERIQESHAFLLVYSITSRASFDRLKKYHDDILDFTYSKKKKFLPPIVVVGNKLDQHHDREVSREEGMKLAKKFGAAFVQTSAFNGRNVQGLFDAVVRSLRKRHAMELVEKDDGKCVIM